MMHECTKCGSPRILYSRTKSRWEKLRRRITAKRPYRCRDCRFRLWMIDSGPHFSAEHFDAASRALVLPFNLERVGLDRDDEQQLDLRRLDELVSKPD